MSVKLMSQVWDLDLPPGEKLVLLALADQANDEGRQCWPSVDTIGRRSGQGERTVRRALATLEDKGFLTRQHRDGTSTQYHVHPCHNGTPANPAPLPKTTKTPANLAPKTPRTTTNGLSNDKPKRPDKAKPAKASLPHWLPAEPFAGYLEMRRRIGKPATPRAIELMIGKLERWLADGHDIGVILDTSTENSWTGLFEPRVPHGTQSRNLSQPAGSRGERRNRCLDMLYEAEAEIRSGEYPDADQSPRLALRAI